MSVRRVIKCVVSHMGVTVPDYDLQNCGAPTCVTSNYKIEHKLTINGATVYSSDCKGPTPWLSV